MRKSLSKNFTRRQVLSTLAVALPSLARGRMLIPAGAPDGVSPSAQGSDIATRSQKRTLADNRFLTFATVIRVNQIEASRGQNLGQDETALHTPEAVAAFRTAFARGWPDGRLTWALSWQALNNQSDQYKAVRRRVAEYHASYGDEVTFIPGVVSSGVAEAVLQGASQ